MHAFARRHNLSAVWLGQEAGQPAPTVLNGFFGPDHYRIELVLLDISRDAADPLLYHIYGKDRYKKQVRAFRGAIRLQRLRPVAIQSFIEELQGEFARFYTAQGEFLFQEFGAAGAGTFSGAIGVDFQQKADSSLAVTYFWGDEHKQYANGDQRYLKGQWVAPHLASPKALLAGVTPESIVPAVLPDFNIGERGFKLNPKYAKLGWDDYWKNEEWWAESPTPNLSL